MMQYTVPSLGSHQLWEVEPANQQGVCVRVICRALPVLEGTHKGKPTWAYVPRRSLVAVGDGMSVVVHPVPTARSTDPSTSHAAAALQTPAKVRNSHQRVLAALSAHGPLTDFELAAKLSEEMQGMVKQTSIGVRRGELVRLGYVMDSDRKGQSDTGSSAIRWMLTQAGREVAS